MLVPVRVVHDGAAVELCLEAVGTQLGLLLADLRALAGPFGLHDGQRKAVGAPQHVVHIPDAVAVGHAGDLVLPVARLVERPPGLTQEHVDEEVPGRGLVVVVIVGPGVCCLSSRDLHPQASDLGIVRGQRLVALLQLAGVRLVLGLELRSEPRQLLTRQRCRLRRQRRVELPDHRCQLGVRAVVQHRPHHDVEQLAQH